MLHRFGNRRAHSLSRRLLLPLLLILLLPAFAHAIDSPALPPVVSSAIRGPDPDSGDTAWMLISSALVMLMMPALALFYAGMVRRKNVLGTMMQSAAVLGIVGIEWVAIGYAMAFGRSHHGLIGWDSGLLFLRNVLPGDLHAGTRIPELVYIMFQGMFAIITPALIVGAFAERVKFSAYALFTVLWSLLVYNPLAHWVWAPGGWLGTAGGLGALDFAGGTVVHVSAGASALVAAIYIGKRQGYPNGNILQPNALVLTLLGAGSWFGWFGFNAGSATASNKFAALAFANTQIAAAAGAMAWLLAEWYKHGRPTSLGFASGLVAGLVAITPASGFVPPWASIIIGLLAGLVCYAAVVIKTHLTYDDSLDAFGVHGVGGFLGALLTGIFASKIFGGFPGGLDGNWHELTVQLIAASTAALYAAILTLIILVFVNKTLGLRLSSKYEIEGIDAAIHGEQGWMLDQSPAPSVGLPGDQSVDLTPKQVFPKIPAQTPVTADK